MLTAASMPKKALSYSVRLNMDDLCPRQPSLRSGNSKAASTYGPEGKRLDGGDHLTTSRDPHNIRGDPGE